jgi:PAS domain S-box-containing protein
MPSNMTMYKRVFLFRFRKKWCKIAPKRKNHAITLLIPPALDVGAQFKDVAMAYPRCKEFPFLRAIFTLLPTVMLGASPSAHAAVIGFSFSDPSHWPVGNLLTVLLLALLVAMLSYVAVMRAKRRRAAPGNEELFRDCFEQALIGIAFEDMTGKLLQVNPMLCSMLGFSEAELLNMSCNEFVNGEDEETNEPELFQELRSGLRNNYHLEKTYVRKDGSKFWGRVHVCKLKLQEKGTPVVLGMVEDITERKQAEQRLHDAQLTLHELTGRLIYAQEEERRRIARELHDDIGQRLSLLMVEMEQISRGVPTISAAHLAALQKALRAVDELTRDVHELSHQLHSTKLSYVGLRAALRELCDQVASQQHMSIAQHLEDDSALPNDVQLCLYRVAQEALNNVAKHSQANSASVYLLVNNGLARLEVTDSGVGFDPTTPAVGLGLASMRERVRTVHGELAVSSNPGKGSTVVAVVPYDKSAMLSRAA